jgi:hypothetical protein
MSNQLSVIFLNDRQADYDPLEQFLPIYLAVTRTDQSDLTINFPLRQFYANIEDIS